MRGREGIERQREGESETETATYCNSVNVMCNRPVLHHRGGVGCLGEPGTVVINVPQVDVDSCPGRVLLSGLSLYRQQLQQLHSTGQLHIQV